MSKPLSDIELEPQGGLAGVFLVPACDAQAIANEFIKQYGRLTDAAIAYADAAGNSPFTAYRNLMRWKGGKQRMEPSTYDLLWTLL